MRYQTHVATSVVAAIAVSKATDLDINLPLMAGVIVGSLFPDIDEPSSYIGRRSLGTARVVNFFFGHRGLTHSLIPCISLVLLCFYFQNSLWLGFTLGYIFHILGDLFSVSGVPLLLPFSDKKFAIPLYKTGGWIEKIIFVVSILLFLQLTKIVNFTNILSLVF